MGSTNSTTGHTVTSKRESSYTHTWIIEESICNSDLASVNLPSVEFQFDLCTDMHFTGNISIKGNTCKEKECVIALKCTTHEIWEVSVILKINDYTYEEAPFSEKTLSLIRKTNDECLTKDINTIKCTIRHTYYETSSIPGIPIVQSKFKHEISQLLVTKDFSDVTFQVGGKEIYAHKTILICGSPVFKTIFQNKMSEGVTNKVVIEDIEAKVFEEMLYFIYNDEVLNLKLYAAKLLPVCDKYDLPVLKSLCARELAANITIENAAEILILADLHQVDELKKWAVEFFNCKRKDVLCTNGFKELLKNQHELAFELLSKVFD